MEYIEPEKVLSRYKEDFYIVSTSQELKGKIKEKISETNVRKIKFLSEGDEQYAFKEGSHFKGEVSTGAEVEGLKLRFVQDFRGIIPGRSPEKVLVIQGKEVKKKGFLFETDSLFLNACPYWVEIIDSRGNKIAGDIKIEILPGEGKIPDPLVFVEKENPESSFPDGNFLLIQPQGQEVPESPVPITFNRLVLEDIDEAHLFEDGSFKEAVQGEKKWCLLPEE